MTSSLPELLNSLQNAPEGLTLGELLALHPGIARRTAQRQLHAMVEGGRIAAVGQGRSRRYRATSSGPGPSADGFPAFIPLSADSRDILAYIDQPTEARHPVGYQSDLLTAYAPNPRDLAFCHRHGL